MTLHDPRAPGTDAYVRILNRDGSPAGACGNGMRCVAWAAMRGRGDDDLVFETEAGLLPASRLSGWMFTVDMGAPRLAWHEIPLAEPFHDTRWIELQIGPADAPTLHTPAVVSMGNPHAVFFVGDVEAYDLGRIGPMLEGHPLFPERANISLAEVRAPDHIRLRVWERGAGLTQACGSAACAALVAAVRRELTERRATVTLPGGDLLVEWRESNGHVLMTGPVEFEHGGVIDGALLASGPA